MKRLITIITLLLAGLIYSGCAIGPVDGIIFTHNKFAGEFNPNNDVPSEKSGRGCERMILGLFAFGDAGAGMIAKMNDIKKISTIDHSTTSVLTIVYKDYCTTVYGR